MSTHKKEIVNGKLNTVRLLFEGTEMLDLDELQKLTQGHGIELHAEGDGVKLNLDLEFTSSGVMEGRFQIELSD